MYYSPPKKSVWGHSLRKMAPTMQRERLELFLAKAVSDHVFSTGCVFYQPAPAGPFQSAEIESHFVELLGLPVPQPGLSNLDEAQFEACCRELVARPSLFEPGRRGAAVMASYSISGWLVAGTPVETSSELGFFYGARPWIVPRFSFDTLAVFDYLRETLESVGLCRLNPKHIKGRKAPDLPRP